ncbi:MAG: hypothetical protein PHF25_00490 [Candidatus Margulisbacteria bacterium]|nr:hypothetical protein [Candidatus Margulisiibacteriota bacterium]
MITHITVPAFENKTKTLVHYGKEYLPTLIETFPLETFHTKTIAALIGILAENSKHNNNNPIDVTISTDNDYLYIDADDSGPGFEAPILVSIKEKFSTYKNSKGKGLFSLIIIIISCNGTLSIQSKKRKEAYSFQQRLNNNPNQIMLDELISAIKIPYQTENAKGLQIKIFIPLKNIKKATAEINLDSYTNL